MTVSIVETKTSLLTANATTNIALTTDLVSTDIVLVITSAHSSVTPTFSLPGVTLVDPLSGTDVLLNGYKHVARWGTGGTGVKTLAITQGVYDLGSSSAVVYVIRGVSPQSVDVLAASTYTNSFVTTIATPSIAVDVGQVVVISALYEGSSATSTLTATPPASGWVSSSANTQMRCIAHDAIGSAQNAVGTASSSAVNAYRGIFGIVFGDPVTTPPLTSTFVGWGVPIF